MAEWLTHWAYNQPHEDLGVRIRDRESTYLRNISMGKPLCLVIEADQLSLNHVRAGIT